jgi:hypothetical protein
VLHFNFLSDFISRFRKSQEVHNSQRRLPGLKKPEPQESGSPQQSKKAARSQEARTSRVWKTGKSQESRIRRKTPNNTALFPPAKGGERVKGKRDSSLKSMVKSREEFNGLSDDSSFSLRDCPAKTNRAYSRYRHNSGKPISAISWLAYHYQLFVAGAPLNWISHKFWLKLLKLVFCDEKSDFPFKSKKGLSAVQR